MTSVLRLNRRVCRLLVYLALAATIANIASPGLRFSDLGRGTCPAKSPAVSVKYVYPRFLRHRALIPQRSLVQSVLATSRCESERLVAPAQIDAHVGHRAGQNHLTELNLLPLWASTSRQILQAQAIRLQV